MRIQNCWFIFVLAGSHFSQAESIFHNPLEDVNFAYLETKVREYGQQAGAAKLPNFVLMIGDDISPDFSCYGGPLHTPHIDHLAETGVRFDHAYVTASSCSPSRCSLITGRYPHNTGAPELHMDLPDGQFLFPEALRDAGYYTAQYGKFHMGDYAKTAFEVVEDVSYREDPTGAEGWVQLLRERPQDRPFFMWFAAYDAHRPWEPDARETAHDPKTVRLPAGVPDTPVARQDIASYYDEVRRFDHYIGAVLDELRRQDVYDDTLVIVMADNGRPFPRSKTSLYDGGMKTPLIIRWPEGGIAVGAVSDSLISTIDIAPAILEAAGVPLPDEVQGISMLSVGRQPASSIREVLFGEQNWHVQRYCGRMVVKGDYLYIRDFLPQLAPLQLVDLQKGAYAELVRLRRESGLPPEQEELFSTERPAEYLFNRTEDPQQLHNLAREPERAEELRLMRALLADWQAVTGDSIPEAHEMTPDRHDRDTAKRLYPGMRPSTGTVPGQRAKATKIH